MDVGADSGAGVDSPAGADSGAGVDSDAGGDGGAGADSAAGTDIDHIHATDGETRATFDDIQDSFRHGVASSRVSSLRRDVLDDLEEILDGGDAIGDKARAAMLKVARRLFGVDAVGPWGVVARLGPGPAGGTVASVRILDGWEARPLDSVLKSIVGTVIDVIFACHLFSDSDPHEFERLTQTLNEQERSYTAGTAVTALRAILAENSARSAERPGMLTKPAGRLA